MTFSSPLVLKYQEAVHVAAFLKRITSWDASSVVRIQTKGRVAGLWGTSPMGCLVFIAVPMSETPEVAVDTVVFAGRLRDILGDLSVPNSDNHELAYRLPEDLPLTAQLAQLPPAGAWVLAERMAAAAAADLVDAAIADYHQQAEMFPGADRAFLDQIAETIWARPGVAAFPLKALHAARSLGFLGHANAHVEFAALDGWKRLATPAGHVFVNTNGSRPKLRVI
ncbi:MAG: hypothetical protein RL441_279 [Actinomycetota bacterium]|mgnify:FL=1